VNQPADYVNGVATLARLNAVQLHGDEDVTFAAGITRPAIKSVTAASQAAAWPRRITLLVDVHDPVRRGGTGSTADWAAARTLARTRRVLLAGGLTAENVAEAIARVQPFGIDVSSGVEAAPGIKDATRLKAFFKAVHS
jgi:phosphoribosylanthranilate isomerase